jgi:hypothetical protein
VAAAVAVTAGNDGLLFGAAGLLAQTGQSIVLSQQADDRFSAAEGGFKGRWHVGNPQLHLETVVGQGVGEALGGPDLLEIALGIGPDLIAQIRIQGAFGFDQFTDAVFMAVIPFFCQNG